MGILVQWSVWYVFSRNFPSIMSDNQLLQASDVIRTFPRPFHDRTPLCPIESKFQRGIQQKDEVAFKGQKHANPKHFGEYRGAFGCKSWHRRRAFGIDDAACRGQQHEKRHGLCDKGVGIEAQRTSKPRARSESACIRSPCPVCFLAGATAFLHIAWILCVGC